jgi:hypothetical protein
MTLWHASTRTELRLTTADAVVAKTVYLAARYMGRLESGRGLDTATLAAKRSAELELDTSG